MVLFPDSPAPAEKEKKAEVKNMLPLAGKYKQLWLSLLSRSTPTEILPLHI